jgi:hypothetical protein
MGSNRPTNVREERQKFYAKYGYVYLDQLGHPKTSPQEVLESIIKSGSPRQRGECDGKAKKYEQ